MNWTKSSPELTELSVQCTCTWMHSVTTMSINITVTTLSAFTDEHLHHSHNQSHKDLPLPLLAYTHPFNQAHIYHCEWMHHVCIFSSFCGYLIKLTWLRLAVYMFHNDTPAWNTGHNMTDVLDRSIECYLAHATCGREYMMYGGVWAMTGGIVFFSCLKQFTLVLGTETACYIL